MIITSRVSGIQYDDENCVFFKNALQSCSYCLWGATLIDVIPTEERKFIFVFSKEEHLKFKKKWINHE